MNEALLQLVLGMWPLLVVLWVRAVLRGLLASPEPPRPTRVRIGLTEWAKPSTTRHDMPDGSEVFLPRGGGALGQHTLKRGRP